MGPASHVRLRNCLINGMFVEAFSVHEDISFVKSDEDGYMLTEQAETFLSKKSSFIRRFNHGSWENESPWNDLKPC